jgi:short-subunit dehydrogenase
VRESHDLKKRYGQGTWVVVTGSGNPLGREFLNTFNQKGFNVIMVDSDEEALLKQKEELASKSLYPDA